LCIGWSNADYWSQYCVIGSIGSIIAWYCYCVGQWPANVAMPCNISVILMCNIITNTNVLIIYYYYYLVCEKYYCWWPIVCVCYCVCLQSGSLGGSCALKPSLLLLFCSSKFCKLLGVWLWNCLNVALTEHY